MKAPVHSTQANRRSHSPVINTNNRRIIINNTREIAENLMGYIETKLNIKLQKIESLILKNNKCMKLVEKSFESAENQVFMLGGSRDPNGGISQDIKAFFNIIKSQQAVPIISKDEPTMKDRKVYGYNNNDNNRKSIGLSVVRRSNASVSNISNISSIRSKTPITKEKSGMNANNDGVNKKVVRRSVTPNKSVRNGSTDRETALTSIHNDKQSNYTKKQPTNSSSSNNNNTKIRQKSITKVNERKDSTDQKAIQENNSSQNPKTSKISNDYNKINMGGSSLSNKISMQFDDSLPNDEDAYKKRWEQLYNITQNKERKSIVNADTNTGENTMEQYYGNNRIQDDVTYQYDDGSLGRERYREMDQYKVVIGERVGEDDEEAPRRSGYPHMVHKGKVNDYETGERKNEDFDISSQGITIGKYYEEDYSENVKTKSKFVRLRNKSKYMSRKNQEDNLSTTVQGKDILDNDEDYMEKKLSHIIDQEDLKFFKFNKKEREVDNDEIRKDRHREEARELNDKSPIVNQNVRSSMADINISENKMNGFGLVSDSKDIFGPSLIAVSQYDIDDDNDKNYDTDIKDTLGMMSEENNLLKKFEREGGPSSEKILKEIEFEKLEVAKMLENMMMSNTSIKENHLQVEEIFKKYGMSESEQKIDLRLQKTANNKQSKLSQHASQFENTFRGNLSQKDQNSIISTHEKMNNSSNTIKLTQNAQDFHSFQNKERHPDQENHHKVQVNTVCRTYETSDFGKQSVNDESSVLRDINNILDTDKKNKVQATDESNSKNDISCSSEYLPYHPSKKNKSYSSPNEELCKQLIDNFKKNGRSEKETQKFKDNLDALLSIASED